MFEIIAIVAVSTVFIAPVAVAARIAQAEDHRRRISLGEVAAFRPRRLRGPAQREIPTIF
jgi:hypothetical protein